MRSEPLLALSSLHISHPADPVSVPHDDEQHASNLTPLTLLREYRPTSIAAGRGRPAAFRTTRSGHTSQDDSFSTRQPNLASFDLWRRLGSKYDRRPAHFSFHTDHNSIVQALEGRLSAHLSTRPITREHAGEWRRMLDEFALSNRTLKAFDEATARAWSFSTDMNAMSRFVRVESNFDLDIDDEHEARRVLNQLAMIDFGGAPEAGTGTFDLGATSGDRDHFDRTALDLFFTRPDSDVAHVLFGLEHKPMMGIAMQKHLSERGAKAGGGAVGFKLRLESETFAIQPGWNGDATVRAVLVQAIDQLYANKCRWLVLLGHGGVTVFYLKAPMDIIISHFIPFDESPDYLTVASVYIALVLPIAPATEIESEQIVWADTLGWKTAPPPSSSSAAPNPSHRSSQYDGGAVDSTTTWESSTSAPAGGAPMTTRPAAAPTSHGSSSKVAKPDWAALAPSVIHCDFSALPTAQGHDLDSWPPAIEEFMRRPWHLEKLSRQLTTNRPQHLHVPLAAPLPTVPVPDSPAPSSNSGSEEDSSPTCPRVRSVKVGGMVGRIKLPASPPVSPTSVAFCSPDRGATVQGTSAPTNLSSGSVFSLSEVMYSGRDLCVRGCLEEHEIVIKFATSTERMAELENETRVYERLASAFSSASSAPISEMFAGSWGLYAAVPSLDPNIHDDGDNRGPARALALVLEYVGEGLDGQYASMGGMTSLDKADVRAAYSHLHAHSITHNDVHIRHCCRRPGAGTVCLIDFGLARLDAPASEILYEEEEVRMALDPWGTGLRAPGH